MKTQPAAANEPVSLINFSHWKLLGTHMYQSIDEWVILKERNILAWLFIYPSNHHDLQNDFLFCPVLALLLIITMVWLVLWSEFQIVISSVHQYPSEHHHQEKQNDQTATHTFHVHFSSLTVLLHFPQRIQTSETSKVHHQHTRLEIGFFRLQLILYYYLIDTHDWRCERRNVYVKS